MLLPHICSPHFLPRPDPSFRSYIILRYSPLLGLCFVVQPLTNLGQSFPYHWHYQQLRRLWHI